MGEERGQEATLVQQVIEARNLKLFHFTRLENLPSILDRGLVARWSHSFDVLGASGIDTSRRQPMDLCLSVGFPNYKMLYKKSRNATATHAILELSPEVLLNFEWMAFPTNTSVSEIRQAIDTQSHVFRSVKALEALFQDRCLREFRGPAKRNEMGIPRGFTTDPQAEILVEAEVIPPSQFVAVHLGTQEMASLASARFADHDEGFFRESATLFQARVDHRWWDNNRLKFPLTRE